MSCPGTTANDGDQPRTTCGFAEHGVRWSTRSHLGKTRIRIPWDPLLARTNRSQSKDDGTTLRPQPALNPDNYDQFLRHLPTYCSQHATCQPRSVTTQPQLPQPPAPPQLQRCLGTQGVSQTLGRLSTTCDSLGTTCNLLGTSDTTHIINNRTWTSRPLQRAKEAWDILVAFSRTRATRRGHESSALICEGVPAGHWNQP